MPKYFRSIHDITTSEGPALHQWSKQKTQLHLFAYQWYFHNHVCEFYVYFRIRRFKSHKRMPLLELYLLVMR